MAVLYTSKEELFLASVEEFISAVTISDEKPATEPLIYARVTKAGAERLV
jgi:pyrimidine-nucleoside phosphorylase